MTIKLQAVVYVQANSSFERSRLKIVISCITQEFTAVPCFGILFIYLVSVKSCHSFFLPGTKMGVPGRRLFFCIWGSPLCSDNVIQWHLALNELCHLESTISGGPPTCTSNRLYYTMETFIVTKGTVLLHWWGNQTHNLVSNELTRVISQL